MRDFSGMSLGCGMGLCMPAGHWIDCMEGAWRESSIQSGPDFPTENRREAGTAQKGGSLGLRLAMGARLRGESRPGLPASRRAPKPARALRGDIRVTSHGVLRGPADDGLTQAAPQAGGDRGSQSCACPGGRACAAVVQHFAVLRFFPMVPRFLAFWM
jgi:hypothetical protein